MVTQFITADGTDTGELSEIRRLFVQGGKVVPMPNVTVGGKMYDSISDAYCNDQKKAFNDTNSFESRGGLKKMGDALDRGMVLVMSLWDDHDVHMVRGGSSMLP